MSNYITFLITILYNDTLLRCALKIHRDKLQNDCDEYPMEPENRKFIHSLLPTHIQSCGPIVEIEEIFDIEIIN